MSVSREVYNATRGSNELPTEWIERHEPEVYAVLPQQDVAKVMTVVGQDLTPVASELDRCMSSSILGQRLFGYALQSILTYRVKSAIDKQLEGLAKMTNITKAEIVAADNQAADDIRGLEHIDVLQDRRDVEVSYRGLCFNLKVRSWLEEIQLRLHCSLRGWAASLSLIPPLGGEDLVCMEATELKAISIEKKLLANAKAARQFVATLHGGEQDKKNGEHLQVM